MNQSQRPELYFSDIEYILCDTAFEPSNHAVSSYRAQPRFVQDHVEELFNKCMASPRVISEHIMGIWKGRFPWLRNIRMIITNEKKSLKKILRYIDATVVLHNMLIDFGVDVNEYECDSVSDIDDIQRIPEAQILNLPIPAEAPKETCREQLKNIVVEKWEPQHNYRRLEMESQCEMSVVSTL